MVRFLHLRRGKKLVGEFERKFRLRIILIIIRSVRVWKCGLSCRYDFQTDLRNLEMKSQLNILLANFHGEKPALSVSTGSIRALSGTAQDDFRKSPGTRYD